MSSRRRPEPLDLDRDLKTTAADVEALGRLPAPRVSFREYLAFLARLGPPPEGALRRRPVPTGAPPFSLED